MLYEFGSCWLCKILEPCGCSMQWGSEHFILLGA